MGRDVEVHCNFAESYARIAHLEEKITQMRHDDMVTQLFTRMNEMDDLLDMVQAGTVDQLELRHKQQDLSGQVRHFTCSYHTANICHFVCMRSTAIRAKSNFVGY